MKKFLVAIMLTVSALSLIGDAIARPMGGGRSFGRQSSSVSQMRAPAPAPSQQYTRPAAPASSPYAAPAAPVKQPSRFGGMLGGALGGALLGFGLGSMFSHMGMGAGMASGLGSILPLILLGLAALFLFRMFRRRTTPAAMPYTGFNESPSQYNATPEIGSGMGGNNAQNYQPVYQPVPQPQVGLDKPHTPWGVPAGFDNDSFLRTAKSSFIRMQAAWDKGDVADLNLFTSPEVFAELKMQIQERGNQRDFTDVVSIDAQLLGIETVNNEYLASVQFNGMIKPAPDALPEPFAEVWNMTKPTNGSGGWVLAGIQQIPK